LFKLVRFTGPPSTLKAVFSTLRGISSPPVSATTSFFREVERVERGDGATVRGVAADLRARVAVLRRPVDFVLALDFTLV
jgi:hypothetical protein